MFKLHLLRSSSLRVSFRYDYNTFRLFAKRYFSNAKYGSILLAGRGLIRSCILSLKKEVNFKRIPVKVVVWKRNFNNNAFNDQDVLWWIIGINVFIFLMWQYFSTTNRGSKFMIDNFTISIHNLKEGRVWTLLTSTFSQKEFFHLVFNMITLYFVGGRMLEVLGRSRFLKLYIIGGLCSTAATVAISLSKTANTPTEKIIREYSRSLGASGSVMSCVVLYGLLFPRSIVMINFILPVPAALMVAMYILIDLYGLEYGSGGVNNVGHLAGAAYGIAYYLYNLRKGRFRMIH